MIQNQNRKARSMTNPLKKPVIPSITGYPAIDTALAAAIIWGSGVITGKIYGLIAGSALATQDFQMAIFGSVVATLVAIATVVWRLLQAKWNQLAVVNTTIEAAATGQIPENVVRAAVKAPTISEEKITAALNNAETIKTQGQ
jgi:hypothetical protein